MKEILIFYNFQGLHTLQKPFLDHKSRKIIFSDNLGQNICRLLRILTYFYKPQVKRKHLKRQKRPQRFISEIYRLDLRLRSLGSQVLLHFLIILMVSSAQYPGFSPNAKYRGGATLKQKLADFSMSSKSTLYANFCFLSTIYCPRLSEILIFSI